MSTNYYLITTDKEFVHNFFPDEYILTENPFLSYRIHLNKLSAGWRPLFQSHTPFKSWKELELFYYTHQEKIQIFNEYNTEYNFPEYKEIIFKHIENEPIIPLKWDNETLLTVECAENEAELFTPIDHVIYQKTNINNLFLSIKYWNDPVYQIDWTEGEFS